VEGVSPRHRRTGKSDNAAQRMEMIADPQAGAVALEQPQRFS
jgi:hypothetical protein